MFILMGLLMLLLGGVAPAAADPYFNSSEPGCGTDPNVLWCEDFEDGMWYQTDCDHGGPDAVANKGWCGNIYASSPATATAPGAAGSKYSASSGSLNGGGGRMADHNFAPSKSSYDELYMRHYRKFDLSQFGQEKFWTVNKCCAGVGGIYFASHWSYPNGSYAHIHLEVPNEVRQGGGLRHQNVSDINMTRGNWYYIEIHMKLNTPGAKNGLWEMWINDCGANGVCSGAPALRARHTDVMWRAAGDNSQMGSVWLENWSAGAEHGAQFPSIGQEYYDKIKVAKTGPIGFAGSSTPPPVTTYTLTATAQGAGTVTGGGSYPVSTVVTPVATTNAGATFTGWSGDCTGMTCTVTMSSHKAVTATFTGGTTPPPTTGCAITPTPAAITFAHPPGGPLPPPQSLRVVTSDASPYRTFDTGFYDAAPCYATSCPSGTLTTITPMPTTLSLAAGTYTYPLDLTAGPNCPKVSVPVVLTIGAAPVPPASMGKLTVEAQVTRCNYFLTAEPPDTTGGWVAQFLRDGANTVGNAISTPPYRRSVELFAPSHSFTVEFSKTGTIKRSPAAVTRACP